MNTPVHTMNPETGSSCHKVIYIICAAVIIACCISVAGIRPGMAGADEASVNFFRLREMYLRWDEGVFGSRAYQRKELNYMLIDLIGRDIKTGYDFLLDPALFTETGNYSSDMVYNNWLYIHGRTDQAPADDKIPGLKELLTEREIGRTLFALSGRIKKFRIEESFRGRFVHLYLESVRIEASQNR